MPFVHKLLILFLLAVLSGCAGLPSFELKTGEATGCAGLVSELEQAVQSQGVMDVQDRRLAGFPYLRVNRFLASFRDEVTGAALEQWLDLMQAKGQQGWLLEYANLNEESQQRLREQAVAINSASVSFGQTLEHCGRQLRETDAANAQFVSRVRAAARVEDNYSQVKRALGLYPLTARAFSKGISDWHEETLAIYSKPLTSLPVVGHIKSYTTTARPVADRAEIEQILRESSENPLAIPLPTVTQQAVLFASYAPKYLIDQASDDDRIGYPAWTADEGVQIDVQHPVVFTYTSWTRFQQQVLLQLNYLIWFPARTSSGFMDLLAGKLDGLIWRVTLLPSGEPLVFDSIHACGCYHLFFAGLDTERLPQAEDLQEAAFFPMDQRFGFSDLPLSLYLSSGSHYINRVFQHETVNGDGIDLSFVSADRLRSLPWSGHQHRSLFGTDGLVAGTERLERFLFWPMGIPSAGAMRQTGHHATAFVGRRHFDDAHLFESIVNLRAH